MFLHVTLIIAPALKLAVGRHKRAVGKRASQHLPSRGIVPRRCFSGLQRQSSLKPVRQSNLSFLFASTSTIFLSHSRPDSINNTSVSLQRRNLSLNCKLLAHHCRASLSLSILDQTSTGSHQNIRGTAFEDNLRGLTYTHSPSNHSPHHHYTSKHTVVHGPKTWPNTTRSGLSP